MASVSFTHEVEELGIVLEVEAEVRIGAPAKLGGRPEDCEPAEGDEIEELSIQLVGDPDNLELDDLSDVYLVCVDRSKVWAKGSVTDGGVPIAPPSHPVWAHDGSPAQTPHMVLPRRFNPPHLRDVDQQGREYVRHLRSLQEIIEERVLEEAADYEPGGDE